MAQYRELATFAQFGTSDLDAATRNQLNQGQMAIEVLKQPQYLPLNLVQETIILYALNARHTEGIELDRVGDFENQLIRNIEASHPDIIEDINKTTDLTDETETKLSQAIQDFKSTFI